jgi:hypothetical protein
MIKKKTCKHCGVEFFTQRSTAKACSLECAVEIGRQNTIKKRDKEDRKALKEGREKLKTRAHWLKMAQSEVNAYVRVRDRLLGCVSCDKPATWQGQWHASHFRSVGAASAVRFNLWNIHKSCSICNNWKSGNLAEYEPRLRARIGNDRVEWLKTQNQLANYTIEYAKRLIQIFRKKRKRLLQKVSILQ